MEIQERKYTSFMPSTWKIFHMCKETGVRIEVHKSTREEVLQAWNRRNKGGGIRDYDTPLLDELEKGPWPSFVKEVKKYGADKK